MSTVSKARDFDMDALGMGTDYFNGDGVYYGNNDRVMGFGGDTDDSFDRNDGIFNVAAGSFRRHEHDSIPMFEARHGGGGKKGREKDRRREQIRLKQKQRQEQRQLERARRTEEWRLKREEYERLKSESKRKGHREPIQEYIRQEDAGSK